MKRNIGKDTAVSTPTLKRGPLELSSPNSPELNEPKKCKNGDVVIPSTQSK